MPETQFKHYNLKLVEPSFSSTLTDLIIELEHLRKKRLGGSTHELVFFQLKHIFHTLESIGSARIEGNKTTIAEYLETKIDQSETHTPDIMEIQNIEDAMSFIEKHISETKINRILISEIHKMVVKGLEPPPHGEGDKTPGEYRKKNVKISKSNHLPPDMSAVSQYMDELFEFINRSDGSKNDLLKIALSHHRFVWIHPFTNGNGRTVRLFTYAMLVKLGFNVGAGRVLNPTAIFCNNRDNYYYNLSIADKRSDEALLMWCEYVLQGLKDEIQKIDKLADYIYLHKEILIPTINHSLERKYITDIEAKILKLVTDKQVVQASDLNDFFKNKAKSEISRQIRKLIDKKMLLPESHGKRKYVIRFDNNYLLRGVIKSLGEKGFIPENDC